MGTTISVAIELARMDTLVNRVGKPPADLLPSTRHDLRVTQKPEEKRSGTCVRADASTWELEEMPEIDKRCTAGSSVAAAILRAVGGRCEWKEVPKSVKIGHERFDSGGYRMAR